MMMSTEARIADQFISSAFKNEDPDYSSKYPKKFNRMIEKAKIPFPTSERDHSIETDSKHPKLGPVSHRTSLSMAPSQQPEMESQINEIRDLLR